MGLPADDNDIEVLFEFSLSLLTHKWNSVIREVRHFPLVKNLAP